MPVAAIGAVIGGIGSIVGGITGGSAAKKAADAQSKAALAAAGVTQANANNAIDYQNRTLGYQRQINQPWLGAGSLAINDVARRLGLNPSPGLSGGSLSANPMPAVPGLPGSAPGAFPAPGGLSSAGNLQMQRVLAGDPNATPNTVGTPLNATKLRFGGQVRGPGTSVSDSVPIKASTGEFVVRADVAQQPGMKRFLEAINRGGKMGGSHFAVGGQVGPMPPTSDPGEQPPGTLGGDMPPGAPGTAPQPAAAPAAPISPAGGDGSSAQPFDPLNYGSFTQGYDPQFASPTNVTEQNDPGYQFRLEQGQKAIERSAAARGGLLTGGTLKDLTNYGQDLASNEYGNVYARTLQNYQTNRENFLTNQQNLYNRLMGVSGAGQNAASLLTGAAGQGASNVGNINMGAAGQIGQDLTNYGTARASGYVGANNAYSSILPNVGNALSLYSILGNRGNSNNPYGPMSPGSDSWMLQPRG